MQIKRNILSSSELEFVHQVLKQERWGFGYISSDPSKPIWNFDKASGESVAKILASKFEGELMDWHINGQTQYQNASLHDDTYNGCTKAVVYFPFDWRFEWGGRLNIFSKQGTTIITPEKNLAVEFDSSLKHYAEGPVINVLRISVGLKFK